MATSTQVKFENRAARDLLELFRESLVGAENTKRAPGIQSNIANLAHLLDRIIAASEYVPCFRTKVEFSYANTKV